MPLTAKGRKIKAAMTSQYGEKKGTSVFYASKNAGKISGVDVANTGSTVSGVGAESWVGGKRTGYSINAAGDQVSATTRTPEQYSKGTMPSMDRLRQACRDAKRRGMFDQFAGESHSYSRNSMLGHVWTGKGSSFKEPTVSAGSADERQFTLGELWGAKQKMPVKDKIAAWARDCGCVRDEHLGFAKLKAKLAHRGGVSNPGALAAAIGRKKFGQAGMTRKSEAGR